MVATAVPNKPSAFDSVKPVETRDVTSVRKTLNMGQGAHTRKLLKGCVLPPKDRLGSPNQLGMAVLLAPMKVWITCSLSPILFSFQLARVIESKSYILHSISCKPPVP